MSCISASCWHGVTNHCNYWRWIPIFVLVIVTARITGKKYIPISRINIMKNNIPSIYPSGWYQHVFVSFSASDTLDSFYTHFTLHILHVEPNRTTASYNHYEYKKVNIIICLRIMKFGRCRNELSRTMPDIKILSHDGIG